MPRLLPLALLAAIVVLIGCGRAPGLEPRGLLGEAPENPERPFFHDAGTLPYGQRSEHVWRLRNTDDQPVTILSATPACACTRVKDLRYVPADGSEPVRGQLDSRERLIEVPPGALLELVVGISTLTVTPNVDKLAVLRVNTDSERTPFLTFEVHVRAEKPFLVKPAELRIGDIPQSYGGASRTTIMTGVRGTEPRIIEVLEASGGIETELDYLFVNNEHVWDLLARVPGGRPLGVVHERVTLATTDANGEGADGRLVVDVWANVVEDVYLAPKLHFGVVKAGAEKRMDVAIRALVPGMRLRIENARLIGDAAGSLRVESTQALGYLDDDGRSDAWNLVLVAADDLAPGQFEAELVVDLDDEQHPEVRSRVLGVVR